ncbi:mitochondrial distribution and morphology protein 10 [Pholiota molesta]|nr:mitochondrial distribution and morphology protein 10 [Pholiota molesta]
MHPFASYVLRSYYKATGWNEDNLYANLTRSSSALLDFTVPHGLHFSVSKSPNALFKTTYAMTAMPSLQGSVGYIFTSCDLDVKSSGNVRFKDMIERFKVYDQPRRPEAPEEEWLAGERVRNRDYLLYGRFFLPTGRLDALYSTRLTPTLQASISAISDPPSLRGQKGDMSNVMVNLQHDVGKWCSEYTWSAEDEMWGVRVLHNFGKLGTAAPPSEAAVQDDAAARRRGVKRVDEEDEIEGGLKGRVIHRDPVHHSTRRHAPSFLLPSSSSATPSPPSSPPLPHGPPFQPPTTITALFNPMLGHISSAYTARVSPDLALSSRFDFNMYSFESEWAMGVEWWLRRPPTAVLTAAEGAGAPPPPAGLSSLSEVNGVIKARASTTNDVSLMWEGRLRNMLVSLGVVSDLSSRSKPIKSLGLEVAFFSSE